MGSINSTATRRVTDLSQAAANQGHDSGSSRLYPEDSHQSAAYGLQEALNGDPYDLEEANERNALHRILNRDVAEPVFQS